MSKLEGQGDQAPAAAPDTADTARTIVQQQQTERASQPAAQKSEQPKGEPQTLDLSADIYRSSITSTCTEKNPHGLSTAKDEARKTTADSNKTETSTRNDTDNAAGTDGKAPGPPGLLTRAGDLLAGIQSNAPGNEVAAAGARLSRALPRNALGQAGNVLDVTTAGVHLARGDAPQAVNTLAKTAVQVVAGLGAAALCSELGPGAAACGYAGATAAGIYYDGLTSINAARRLRQETTTASR